MRWAVLLGAAGSVAVAVSSWFAAALPMSWEHVPAWRVVFFAGVAALVVAWLLLGRGSSVVTVRRACVAWSAPLLGAAPVESRDLYAYLAQARVLIAGHDPYRVGPAVLHDAVSGQVSARWQHAPTPYGPVWLLLTRGSAALTGDHVIAGVLVLRLFAVMGLVLLGWGVPRLASGHADSASWLVIANPFVLVVCLGGGHNDLLMTGLLVAALVLARQPGSPALAGAAVVVTVAALVKAPAAAALPFLIPVHVGAQTRLRALGRPYMVVVAAAAATLVIVTVASGLGLGWVSHLGRSPDDPYGWLSLTDPVIMLANGSTTIVPGTSAVRAVDAVAAALTLLVLLGCWLRSHRSRPVSWLALGLLGLVLLAPTIRQWYLCWPLAAAAVAGLPRRIRAAVVGVSVVLAVGSGPEGNSLLYSPVEAVAVAAALVSAAVATRGFRPVRSPLPAAERRCAGRGRE